MDSNSKDCKIIRLDKVAPWARINTLLHMLYGLGQQLPWNPEYRSLILPVLQGPALLTIWPFCGYISFSIPGSRGHHGTSAEVRRKAILCALRLIWDMLRHPELVREGWWHLSSCKNIGRFTIEPPLPLFHWQETDLLWGITHSLPNCQIRESDEG